MGDGLPVFSGENRKAPEDGDVQMPDQELARLKGGKIRPEDRNGEIAPPPVKNE